MRLAETRRSATKMNAIFQNARHPWSAFSCCVSTIAWIGFLLLGYYNWPPKLSGGWIIGPLVGIGAFLSSTTSAARMFYSKPYKFEITDSEIIIEDWGFIQPRSRKFDSKSVTDIVFSSEGTSFLKTKDGKYHYIDDLLMLRHYDIMKLVGQQFKHINRIY